MANFRDMFLRVRWSLTDVNKMWLFIKHNFMKILNKNVPTKMFSTKHYLPWYNKEIKNLIRRKKLWYERAKKRDNEKTWRKYKDIKRIFQNLCRKAYENYINDIILEDKSNNKFWSYIKSQKSENTNIGDILHNNKTLKSLKEKANAFNIQFCKVFSNPGPKTNSI